MSEPVFFGKYRGVVSDTNDPHSRGRLLVSVPDVFGDQTSGWALPALPYAADGVGLLMLPPRGARVWVEFEHGNSDSPIWTGCFWDDGQPPVTPATEDKKILKTSVATILVDDSPGSPSLSVETAAGMKITLDTNGITIDNGKGARIELTGPKTSVNGGALEVT
jgi:uncharacterized protein involved in type VI secretion and phage assembly